jgi:hypothetical protein
VSGSPAPGSATLDFLEATGALDEGCHARADVSAAGLYFCGCHVSSAGMLREIDREA